jgi:hypothetical protein
MRYDELLDQLNPCRSFPTLGGRSSFCVCKENGVIWVINSGGTRMKVTRDFYAKVWNRYLNDLSVEQRNVSQNFTDTGWDECPGRILAPYLPAIWKNIANAEGTNTPLK